MREGEIALCCNDNVLTQTVFWRNPQDKRIAAYGEVFHTELPQQIGTGRPGWYFMAGEAREAMVEDPKLSQTTQIIFYGLARFCPFCGTALPKDAQPDGPIRPNIPR